MPKTSETWTIKKYPNRRLYDVTHSRYITLDELVSYIQSGVEVVIIDSKTQKNITQPVLLQVWFDHSEHSERVFSSPFLHQLIRNQDGVVEEFVLDWIPKMLDSYMDMKEAMKRQISSIITPRQWFTQTKDSLMMQLPSNDQQLEIERLRQQVADLEKQIQNQSGSSSDNSA